MRKKDLKVKLKYYKRQAVLLEKQLKNWQGIAAERLEEKKPRDLQLQVKMLSVLSSIQSRIILQTQLEEITAQESNDFFDFFFTIQESIIDGQLGE